MADLGYDADFLSTTVATENLFQYRLGTSPASKARHARAFGF